MFLTPSEKADPLIKDENGQLPQWLWKQNFMKIFSREIEPDSEFSENEASDEDLALNQEIEHSPKKNRKSTPSVLFVHEPNKTLKLATDTLDYDNNLVNQENDSVLKTVRSWISKSKLPTKDVVSRQC